MYIAVWSGPERQTGEWGQEQTVTVPDEHKVKVNKEHKLVVKADVNANWAEQMEVTRIISIALKNADDLINKGQANSINKALNWDISSWIQRQGVRIPVSDQEFEKDCGREAECRDGGEEQSGEGEAGEGRWDK